LQTSPMRGWPGPPFVTGLGRGINFGNALDTVREGEAGFRLRERYFDDVRDAGFDTVRLPVRWSAHAGESWPYSIDPAFFERVGWAIDNALGRDLNIVLNAHHSHELTDAPGRHQPVAGHHLGR
jgi:endoglucanase